MSHGVVQIVRTLCTSRSMELMEVEPSCTSRLDYESKPRKTPTTTVKILVIVSGAGRPDRDEFRRSCSKTAFRQHLV